MGAILLEKQNSVFDLWNEVLQGKNSKNFFRGQYFVSIDFLLLTRTIADVKNAIAMQDKFLLYNIIYEHAEKDEKEFLDKLFSSCHPLSLIFVDNGIVLTNRKEDLL